MTDMQKPVLDLLPDNRGPPQRWLNLREQYSIGIVFAFFCPEMGWRDAR